jgi:hypothetical protein
MVPVAADNRWARALTSVLVLIGLVFALASCAANPSQPFAKSTPSASGAGRIPPPIAIISMNGVPPAKAGVLADALADAAGQRDIAIVQGNFSDGYQLAGNFQAVSEGGGVRIVYQWSLTGNTGGELHRINGQELVPASGADPWAGVSDVIIKRIASLTAESLSTKLAQLGFKVRQAGVLPPSHTFAQAGPNAEKELDLETYYGPNSPFTIASITPNELYTLTPEQLDARLTAAAQKQAQERLAAAGVTSLDDLMGEPGGSSGEEERGGRKQVAALEDTPTPGREQLATAQPAPDPKTELASKDKVSAVAIDKVALVAVTGSPGRGNDELFRAMRKVLRQAGWPVVKKPGKSTLSISGRVDLKETTNGVQQVKLAWAVKLPTGKVLGTVRQSNDVPAGSLNEGWGQTAGFAAEAAAEGIFKLVEGVRAQ